MRKLIDAVLEPIPEENRRILAERRDELPPELRVPWQAVGLHMPHCGFVMGPSYCSFTCTHCYLPKNANRAPLPSLEEMKEQIDANRRLLGHAGNLQITGGDVIDAYVRAGKSDQLIEVLRYATERGLVPMLMTHGQKLLEDPGLLDRLVTQGRMRKLAVHIDITQAGRPGYPRRELHHERELHPLRQEFVDLILDSQKRTGIRFTAAHTVTVTEANLDSFGDIITWLLADRRRLKAFSMLSLQPEAAVGRTRFSAAPATPEATWEEVTRALGQGGLAEDNLWFGHPSCSRMTTLLALFPEGRLLDTLPGDAESKRLRARLAAVFGGAGARGAARGEALLRRVSLVARHPGCVLDLWRYGRHLAAREKVSRAALLWALMRRRVGALNIVQHNFMSSEEIRRGGPEVERRLAACSFRGATRTESGWQAMPMCSMNTDTRERLYSIAISQRAK
ncbi:MAG: hypothetical protein AAF725_16225 [Acidobacteriota bacterium]